AFALVVFVLVELRTREPLIDMRLTAIRGVWATNIVGLAFGFAMYGTFLLVPTLLELPRITGYGLGKSVSSAGLFLLPTTLMMLIFGPLSGVLERRFGPKLPLTLGAVAVVAAFALPAVSHDAVWQLLASGILTGAGIGLVFAAMSNAIIESVPATQTGEATSVNSIVRTIGGSIGSAVVAAVIAADTTAQGLPEDRAFTVGFWVGAALRGTAAVPARPLRPARRRHQQAAAAGVGAPPPEPEEIHLPHRSQEVDAPRG